MTPTLSTLNHAEHPVPEVRYDRTIDRTLVHRAAVAEVFVTDVVASGRDDVFVVGVQLPRRHGFYRSTDGRHDTLLLAEVLRQSVIAVAHSFYDVPLNSRFTMQLLGIAVPERSSGLIVDDAPAQLRVRIVVRNVHRRQSRVAALQVDLEFVRDGKIVATGTGDARIFDDSGYQKVRWGGAEPRTPGSPSMPIPVDPDAVGVVDREDVVLGRRRGEDSWPLRIDPTHPVLFDHSCDHVPGMLILEGIRQAVRLAVEDPQAILTSIDARFMRFAELDAEVTVTVKRRSDSDDEFTVTCVQDGHPVADADVRLSVSRQNPSGRQQESEYSRGPEWPDRPATSSGPA
ncbi:MAG: ScbA/BarX family gamma-butyrolactone biosynthesis protein [Gordonia sp. (in: high G+C Gram-positive bacteria)]|uniref:ScbA/BarX family gamma-butyrolactone biosynthesis protein n=1 Tax=Gordonia sp. (in: high G+C Gram-positive bacteria) TaxID=84139 RepID=UPI0039E6E24F